MVRPIDHDESQYVAAAVLTAHGLIPYRDYAYLQTPLQPYAFAVLAAAFGTWTWPSLRLVNALLGAVAIACVHRAARAGGASAGAALAAAGGFASCDILLFSIGTARNDALPAACLAAALPLIVRQDRDATPLRALLTGLLLAAAAAAKISYALPAATYGAATLFNRRRLPLWVALGAAPPVAFVLWAVAQAPSAAAFGIFQFPSAAPAQFYAASTWKQSLVGKIGDTLKFLALGAALPTLALLVAARRRTRPTLIEALALAGLVAALLPVPTWRQYLLPMLPPLFVAAALLWTVRPPGRRARVVLGVFAGVGAVASLYGFLDAPPRSTMVAAFADGHAIRAALDRAGEPGPVATLSPEFLPATGRLPDPRFATGPFYFRSHDLVPAAAEPALRLVSRPRLGAVALLPPAVLVGGEGRWDSGDPRLDDALEGWARQHRYRRIAIASDRFRLYVAPR